MQRVHSLHKGYCIITYIYLAQVVFQFIESTVGFILI